MAETASNLLCLLVFGLIMFRFGRMWEHRRLAHKMLTIARWTPLFTIRETEEVEPEPITARNPNTALAALAMKWDQEAWVEPEPIIGGAVLWSDEERSYHHAEAER